MHEIRFLEFDSKVTKDEILCESAYISDCYGDFHNQIDNVRFIEYTASNRDEAERYIKEHDRGFYDCLAVKYTHSDPDSIKTEKYEELNKKYRDTYMEYTDKQRMIYPKTLKAEYITCKQCGSKLYTKLAYNACPLCHQDLRPDSWNQSIKKLGEKSDAAYKKLQDYISKHGKKSIKWLVKIEYHS